MKLIITLTTLAICLSCTSKTNSQEENKDTEKIMAEALAKSEKLLEEANAKAKANEEKVLEGIENNRKLASEEKKKQQILEQALLAKKQQWLVQNDPSLSFYNGFYYCDCNSPDSFIFIDGVLTMFEHSDFKTTYKSEHHFVKEINKEGLIKIKAHLQKDRHGKVNIKETILTEGPVIVESGQCVGIKRGRRTYKRHDSFRRFMSHKEYYPLDQLVQETIEKYGHTKEKIDKALNRKDFYKCKAFIDAAFYNTKERITLIDVLDSIVKM